MPVLLFTKYSTVMEMTTPLAPTGTQGWTFLTDHGRVLARITTDPDRVPPAVTCER